MKKWFAMMMGVIVLMLAACATDGEMDEANGEGTEDQPEEEVVENQEPEVDMDALIDQVTMDATVETDGTAANFDFSLTNDGEEAVILGFTSSQKYEIQVTNADGENVYTFSADKMFTQEMTTEELANGETLTASETWTGAEPGEYEATFTFLVDTINDQSVEANPFEVTQSFTIEAETEEEVKEEEETKEEEVKEFEGDGQAFREIKVSGQNGSYVVSGEARVFEGSFMYSIEDGHNMIVEPTAVQVDEGAPSWSAFEIEVSIPEEKLPEFGTVTMSIFEESAKGGKPTNVNYIPLESIQPEE
ncbi:hypothetical protein H0266_06290 [Halobacillus locisalis]|uniref:Immunoglobulin-like domain of spore germination n=1 Tax=Halobacillus locisalis TaxID=220753 RepID=A0A838CRW8_9BACI|nr:BsuPI-related putative proteinase inhibitor [Halobacillus locisalis]MBA2174515.1 hypothetical protein [Halobacillus locisalis]